MTVGLVLIAVVGWLVDSMDGRVYAVTDWFKEGSRSLSLSLALSLALCLSSSRGITNTLYFFPLEAKRYAFTMNDMEEKKKRARGGREGFDVNRYGRMNSFS